VRFDRLAKIYYLGADNCIYDSDLNNLEVCGVSDFEVTVDKRLICLTDGTVTTSNDGKYSTNPTGEYQYTYYDIFIGLTLYKGQPVFIDKNYRTAATFNNESVVSISVGTDASVWALLYEEGVKDYKLAKWRTHANKWYIVEGKRGVNLSAYNEISVALVDSKGLVFLSSSLPY
jgi:hypothetical protein